MGNRGVLNVVLLTVTAQDVAVSVATVAAIVVALLGLRALIRAGSGIVCVVFVNTSSEEEAVRIGQILIEVRLAAAVNITQPIRSLYRWQGKVEDRPETLMVIKTTRGCLKKLVSRVAELHSYQVPGILALPVFQESHRPYLNWVAEAVKSDGGGAQKVKR